MAAVSVSSPYLMSSIPATWIDQLLLYSPEFGTTESFNQSGARALSLLISVTVFPLFVLFDLGIYTALLLSNC